MKAPPWETDDVVARLSASGVELVRVAKCNSRRVVSYLIPGRKKPIAGDGGEFVTINQYQEAAARLYDKDFRAFDDVVAARRALMDEADS